MSRTGLVCAIDVGTSAVRASLISASGVEIRSARRARPASEGSVDFDTELLWDDVVGVLRELAVADAEPECLAIAGHVGTVLLDEAARPLGRGIGWSSTVGAAELQSAWSDAKAALRIAGRPAVTGGAAAFLAWLKVHQPETHRRVRWVLSPKDDLIRRLSSTFVTDSTSAAYTLASDIRLRQWSTTLTAATGVDPECFPPQYAGTHIVGTVTDTAARLTGLPPGLPITAGGPDGTVGSVAVTGARAGVVVDVAGTTDVLTRVVVDPDDEATRDTVTNPYLVDDVWSCGGPTGMTGGAVAQWTRLLGLGEPAEAAAYLESALDDLPPGCDGLFVLPFFSGSRFPEWRPFERAAVWGMNDKHTNAHLVRGAQEAAAFVVRAGLLRLMNDQPEAPIVLAGGTARSANLVQLRADVLDRPVLACADPDVTLRGAAMLACVGAGIYATLTDASAAMTPPLRRFNPDPNRALAYHNLFDEWSRVREMLAH